MHSVTPSYVYRRVDAPFSSAIGFVWDASAKENFCLKNPIFKIHSTHCNMAAADTAKRAFLMPLPLSH